MKEFTKKAQAGAIIGLLSAVIIIFIFSIMLSPLITFIDIGVNATANVTNGSLIQITLQIIPVFLALIILVAIVLLILGR